ncbi:WUS-interacting protein 2 [Actinidia rufa]|uniref:WUS-interacting protein 2 n=1 Tax=Actinidia rufa TaxID=165716 RepID=A0A7J0GBP8_9ERIC|nr:WUS-interacting protein 2 [Actinidia rufa]
MQQKWFLHLRSYEKIYLEPGFCCQEHGFPSSATNSSSWLSVAANKNYFMERQAFRNFKVWDLGRCTMTLQVLHTPSILCIYIYAYHGGAVYGTTWRLMALIGNVSDLAFSHPNKQLCIITCGEDKAIVRVWDVVTGSKQYTCEGHEAPVVDYDAPGHSCTTMAYSADGTRLFSCGTTKEGESHIVEWNESEGALKRMYHGLEKRENGVKILANSDGVRFMRSLESPALDPSRISPGTAAKTPIMGTFGASTSDAGTNVGVADGNAPVMAMVAPVRLDTWSWPAPRITDEREQPKIWKMSEINEPSQLRSLRLS